MSDRTTEDYIEQLELEQKRLRKLLELQAAAARLVKESFDELRLKMMTFERQFESLQTMLEEEAE